MPCGPVDLHFFRLPNAAAQVCLADEDDDVIWPTRTEAKRTRLTNIEKLKIIGMCKIQHDRLVVVSRFGMATSTLSGMLKQQEVLRTAALNSFSKSSKQSHFVHLDNIHPPKNPQDFAAGPLE
jgi:hypothetical protein